MPSTATLTAQEHGCAGKQSAPVTCMCCGCKVLPLLSLPSLPTLSPGRQIGFPSTPGCADLLLEVATVRTVDVDNDI